MLQWTRSSCGSAVERLSSLTELHVQTSLATADYYALHAWAAAVRRRLPRLQALRRLRLAHYPLVV